MCSRIIATTSCARRRKSSARRRRTAVRDAQPQVQLRFSAEGVDAIVRYPVELLHAAEIDERVSREVLQVISSEPSASPAV